MNCGADSIDLVVNYSVDGVPQTPAMFAGVPSTGQSSFNIPFACTQEDPHEVACTVDAVHAGGALPCSLSVADTVSVICTTARPVIVSILDVENDQGRQVRINFPFALLEAGSPTGLERGPVIPVANRLYPSYPNPFHSATVVRFDLPEAGPVSLRVLDLQGRLVRTLIGGQEKGPGQFVMTWNGTDDGGRGVSPGMYLVSLETRSFEASRKVLFIR